MRKIWLGIVIFFLVVFGIYWQGRTITYPVGTNNGESYGGEGMMTVVRQGEYAVDPMGEAPFFVKDLYQANKYEGGGNKIIPIPDREELVYAVGEG